MSFYILLSIAIVLAFYIWHREKSRLSFYTLIFLVIVILFGAAQDFVKYKWHLAGVALAASDTINAIFWTAAGITLIVIMIKFFKRK
jgi:hypothetical protein